MGQVKQQTVNLAGNKVVIRFMVNKDGIFYVKIPAEYATTEKHEGFDSRKKEIQADTMRELEKRIELYVTDFNNALATTRKIILYRIIYHGVDESFFGGVPYPSFKVDDRPQSERYKAESMFPKGYIGDKTSKGVGISVSWDIAYQRIFKDSFADSQGGASSWTPSTPDNTSDQTAVYYGVDDNGECTDRKITVKKYHMVMDWSLDSETFFRNVKEGLIKLMQQTHSFFGEDVKQLEAKIKSGNLLM